MSIRIASIDSVSSDSGPFKIVKVKADGKVIDAQVMELTGVQSAPIVGGLAFIFELEGDEGRMCALCMPPPKDRVDAQETGEMTLLNHLTGSSMKFDKEKNITMSSENEFVSDSKGDTIIRSEGIVRINP